MKLKQGLAILIGAALIIAIWINASFNTTHSSNSAIASAQETSIITTDRFQTGLSIINRVNQGGYERARNNLVDIAPDFIRFGIEFPYGDVLSRSGLDLKSRQIGTVAALTALGNVQSQLKFHIQGALNVGCTRQEIVELITQMSVYAGFPKAANAMTVAKEVFQELDAQSK